MATITCTRCGQDRDQMPFRPFQNDIGLRVYEHICNVCWSEWLKTQQQLINHYALNLRDQNSKDFLFTYMHKCRFGQGNSGK